MSNPWDEFERAGTAPATPTTGGGDGLYRIPDPSGDERRAREREQDVRDQGRFNIDVDRAGRDNRNEARNDDDRAFRRTADLRAEYDRSPSVSAYREAVTAFEGAMNQPQTPEGDQALVYAFAKMMDPASAVREGEAAGIQQSGGYVASLRAQIAREFGMDGSGQFTPEQRARLLRAMNERLGAMNTAYNERRSFYQRAAQAAGVDPSLVIGEHAAAPMRERYLQFADRMGWDFGRQQQDGELVTGYDRLTDSLTTNDIDPGDRMTPDQEGAFRSFLASRGENITAAEINDWMRQNTAFPGINNAEEIATALRNGRAIRGPDYSAVDDQRRRQLEGMIAEQDAAIAPLPGEDAKRLITQGQTLGLSDEAAGVGGGLVGLLDGRGFTQGYRDARDMERLRAQSARDDMGWTGTALEIGGGLLSGRVPVAGAPALTVGRAARQGAEAGAVAGFGYGEGAGTPGSVATGALLGGAAGGAVARLAGNGSAGNVAGREVADAAQRIGVEPYSGWVAGDRTRRLLAGAEQTFGGSAVVNRAAGAANDSAEAALGRIASNEGVPINSRERIGEAIRTGSRAEITRLHNRANTLYESARRLSEGARVSPTQGFQVLSDHIDELADTGMAQSGLSILRSMQRRMAEGPINVQTLRNMRTTLRDDLTTTNLRGSDIERRADEVLAAVAEDLDEGLRRQGMTEAADLFRQADQSWANLRSYEDEVVFHFIGRDGSRSGEQIADALNRDIRGNSARGARLLESLPAETRGNVRASIIQRMGQARPGAQNAEGDAFSLETFLTNYSQMEEPARIAFFGQETRSALNDLARVAQGAREAGTFRNRSNTAGAMDLQGWGWSDILTLGARVWGPMGVARAITSPGFTRWLARAERLPNQQAQRQHIARLTAVARSEPAIANDILGLQARLNEAFSGVGVRAAAGDENDNERNRVNTENEGVRNER